MREAQVAKLEEEELELIRKLQNTQLHQEAAYAELENALSTPSLRSSGTDFRKSSNKFETGKSPNSKHSFDNF